MDVLKNNLKDSEYNFEGCMLSKDPPGSDNLQKNSAGLQESQVIDKNRGKFFRKRTLGGAMVKSNSGKGDKLSQSIVGGSKKTMKSNVDGSQSSIKAKDDNNSFHGMSLKGKKGEIKKNTYNSVKQQFVELRKNSSYFSMQDTIEPLQLGHLEGKPPRISVEELDSGSSNRHEKDIKTQSHFSPTRKRKGTTHPKSPIN